MCGAALASCEVVKLAEGSTCVGGRSRDQRFTRRLVIDQVCTER